MALCFENVFTIVKVINYKSLCYKGMFQITDGIVVQHFARDKPSLNLKCELFLRDVT